jgi:hypothetical protein
VATGLTKTAGIMSEISNDESLRDEARTLRTQMEADARARRFQHKRLERFRQVNRARSDATRDLLSLLDPFNQPPSAAKLKVQVDQVMLLLAETLAALREADLLKELEKVGEPATLAHYRQVGDNPKENRINYEYAQEMIKTDPTDRLRLAQLVWAAVEEPGLRRAWEWVAIQLNRLADDLSLIKKDPVGTTPLGPSSRPVGDGNSVPILRAPEQEEGGESNEPQQSMGPESKPKATIVSDPPLGTQPRFKNWALAFEPGGKWHLFKRFGSDWRCQGRATGITKGMQDDLLKYFAAGGGLLTDVEAVKLVRQTYSKEDKKRIMKIIKPVISRLRQVIRRNLNITHCAADPLPRDKRTGAWQARIQIGYAIENDEDRLEFKLIEQLSGEKTLDL